MTTEFINSLTPINVDDPQTQVVEDFLTYTKGIANPHNTALGYNDEDPVRMYYYRMGDGVLEMEVEPDGKGGYDRKVTDFITDPVTVHEMLGEELMTESARKALARKLTQFVPGQRLTGKITGVRDDIGLFVQIRPSLIGLAHIESLPPNLSEPSQHFDVGDQIDVRVLRFNKRTNRLALTVIDKPVSQGPST